MKKPPWVWRMRPWPLQCWQVFGLVPALAPEPEQASQVTEVGSRTCAVLPAKASSSVISMLKRRSAPRSRPERALARAAHAEDALEDVGEGRAEIGAEAVRAAADALLEGGVAEAVVGGALVAVLQDVIGLVDFLELGLAILVAGIAVGMKLHGELAIRGLHVGLASQSR